MEFKFQSISEYCSNATSSIVTIGGRHIDIVYHDGIAKTIELYFLKGSTPEYGFYSSRCHNIKLPNDFGSLPSKYTKFVLDIIKEHQKHFTNI